MIDYNDKAFNAAKRRGYLTPEIMENASSINTFSIAWVNKFKNDLKALDVLSRIVGRKEVEWEDFTENTLTRFREEILSLMCVNSAKTTFAKVKGVLNRARYNNNIPCDPALLADLLNIRAEPSDHVYLTEEELIAFSEVKCYSDEERYVKCICMIEGTTGARHIDCLQMTPRNINTENDTLSYTSQKTRITATVPVIFNLEKWMKGFDHNITMLDCTFNDIIRELLCRAHICQHIEKKFNKGQSNEKKKYEYCSSHTFRRSYATNLFLGGVEIADIAQMMGHTSTDMTMKYICATRFVSKRPKRYFIRKNIYRYQ